MSDVRTQTALVQMYDLSQQIQRVRQHVRCERGRKQSKHYIIFMFIEVDNRIEVLEESRFLGLLPNELRHPGFCSDRSDGNGGREQQAWLTFQTGAHSVIPNTTYSESEVVPKWSYPTPRAPLWPCQACPPDGLRIRRACGYYESQQGAPHAERCGRTKGRCRCRWPNASSSCPYRSRRSQYQPSPIMTVSQTRAIDEHDLVMMARCGRIVIVIGGRGAIVVTARGF
jgi:hypothetical protein